MSIRARGTELKKEKAGGFGRFSILLAAFAFAFLLSCSIGRYPIRPTTIAAVLVSRVVPIRASWPAEVETVLFHVRLPRVAAAALIGAALACAGAAYQGIFRNPMASPDMLGASAGAGFGAALAIFSSAGYVAITLCSFACGMAAIALVFAFVGRLRSGSTLALVLAGIMTGSLFSSSTSFLKLVADPTNVLPAITYWLMGSLASIRAEDLRFAGPLIAAGIVPLFLFRWRINVMTAGEDEARAMGVDTRIARVVVIAGATLATAASVAVSGLIGWVGLVIPHFARMAVGPDYRALLPASILMGATFLLLVDDAARMISTQEVPLGILTAFVGAPFFLYLIRKEDRRA